MKSLVSKYLSINAYDILKAALVTFLYAFFDGLVTYCTNSNQLPDTTQLKSIFIQSGLVLIAYVKVKAFTNSEGKLFTKDPLPAVEAKPKEDQVAAIKEPQ